MVFPLPINLGTINQFFRAAYSPDEARALDRRARRREFDAKDAANLEEKAISLIGRPLYEAFIRDYTAKQWQTDPTELPAEVISRLPVRYNYDNRYFNDTCEGLPIDGYTAWLERMADHPNIEVRLDTDFFDEAQPLNKAATVGPGPRRLHRPGRPLLRLRRGRAVAGARSTSSRRSLPVGDFQGTVGDELRRRRRAVHPHPRVPALPPGARRRTRRTRPSSCASSPASPTRDDEPYYPVNTAAGPRQAARLPRARQAASRTCYFGGRLGTYQYLDMHMAIGSALTMFNNKLEPALRARASAGSRASPVRSARTSRATPRRR